MADRDTDLLDERELSAWQGMLVTHSRITAALDEELEREHGLALSSYEVLLQIATSAEGSLRMGELADRLLLSRSGLTRLVDRLVARGLVERHSCPDDRRGSYARLTGEGKQRFAEARPTHMRGIREHFLSKLRASDLAHLATAWDRVLGADRDAVAPAAGSDT